MKREQWKSRLGFIWAAVGSAIGLGSIWRFPYVVGDNGGATFIFLYLICLVLVGFPVLISEIMIGRKTQTSPLGAFFLLGRNKTWKKIGKMTIITGFLVSSFYGVISALTLGYFFEAIFGKLTHFSDISQTASHFMQVSSNAFWVIAFQFLFMVLCVLILFTGVRKGIEAGNKIMMPLLLLVLIALAIKGITMEGSERGITFLFKPNWSLITPTAIVMALGQAFFSLSLGQGTMITYGSYVPEKENLPSTCLPITIFGILVSLLSGLAIFTIVFAVGMKAASGESLMFQTLPIILSKIPGGYFLAVLFFLLLVLAALTSQISALEPMIAYLVDEKKWGRHKSVLVTVASSFVIGIPSALSLGVLKTMTVFGMPFFQFMIFLCLNILIPLGGLASVILVAWRWGIKNALKELKIGTGDLFTRYPILKTYFHVSIKYIAPIIIVLIFIDQLR